MSREYLATKLMSGHNGVPAKTRWWPIHSKDLSRFLLLSESSDRKAMLSTRQLLYTGASEWDEFMCGSAVGGPMSEHVKLEIELVDAAVKMDIVRMKRVGELLRENVLELLRSTIKRAPEIPKERLGVLLVEHVSGFIESVMRYIDDDEKAFTECEKRRAENTLALAVLTTECV